MTVQLSQPDRMIQFLSGHFPGVVPRYALLSAPRVTTRQIPEENGLMLRVFDQGEHTQRVVDVYGLNWENRLQELVFSTIKQLTNELWLLLQMRKRRFYAGWR